MAKWHLAPTDDPYRPYAVVDGHGSLAGCHVTREAATIQMEMLNVHGLDPETEPDPELTKKDKAPARKADPAPTLGKPYNPPPIAFSRSTTAMW